MAEPSQKRFRNVVFTSFEVERQPTFLAEKMRYLVYQQEICPETGRKHWQGYVEFKSQYGRKAVQLMLGVGECHLEVRRGTAREAAEYCKKEETRFCGPWEHGVITLYMLMFQ